MVVGAARRMRAMRITAIVNQKGGCGKTTTAINLASVLARGGTRTLLVDLDPQSHCAVGLGIPESKVEVGMAHALAAPDRIAFDTLLWDVASHLKLAPSTVELAAFEATTPGGDRDRRLECLLSRVEGDFDWCVIDCPPTIGLLTFNALRACDETIVPVETGYFSLRGAERQVATVEAVAARLGRGIALRLLAAMHREGAKVAQEVLAALSRRFPDLVVPVVVREHEVLREAASFGQPIPEFAPQSPAHEDFRQLAEWLRRQTTPPRPPFSGPPFTTSPAADEPGAGVEEAASTKSDRAAELVARMRRSAAGETASPSEVPS